MHPDVDKAGVSYVEATRALERRVRNIFFGSLALCVLVVFHCVFLPQPGGTLSVITWVSFPAVLLWSLTVAAYAFYSLWRIADERKRLLEGRELTDPKTGLKSLHYVRTLLQNEYERAIQTKQPMAVLYVDLQELDTVNRNFGHAVGDIVLREVARSVESSVPDGATVGRVGGDEFLVVVPATGSEKARSVVAAIEKAVRDYRLDLGKRGSVDFLDCRIGMIACPQDAGLVDEIMRIAQEAAGQCRTGPRRGQAQEPD